MNSKLTTILATIVAPRALPIFIWKVSQPNQT